MKKISSLILVCAGLISLVSSAAYAGNRPGALTLTIGGGQEYFSSKRHLDNTGVGLLEVAYDLTDHWGIEGLLGKLHTNFKGSINDDRHVNGTLFAVNGVYHFNTDRMFEPYVLAGAGITELNPNRFDAHDEGNVNAAVGAQIFVHKSIAFRVEARDLYTFVGGKNDVLLNGGVSILFDLC
jgi:OOP family OmpA-OmpF porin